MNDHKIFSYYFNMALSVFNSMNENEKAKLIQDKAHDEHKDPHYLNIYSTIKEMADEFIRLGLPDSLRHTDKP